MFAYLPLNSQSKAIEKKGYLLRRICRDGSILYSDVFTWPEMGDPSVEEVMQDLCKAYQPTSKQMSQGATERVEIALSNLRTITPELDSQKVRSHYLYNWGESSFNSALVDSTIQSQQAQILENPAATVKFKLFQNWHAQLQTLHKVAELLGPAGRLRLDFNSCLDENAFFEFEKKTRNLHQKIDFIEDPTPYNHDAWVRMNQVLPLALDFEIRNYSEFHSEVCHSPFDWVIFKPAAQRFSDVEVFAAQKKKMVVTSYLGHPISQQIAKLRHVELIKMYNHSIHPVGGWIHQHLYQKVIEGSKWLNVEHFLKS